MCSQEGQPGMSKNPREIARQTGISHTSVHHIAKKNLCLKTFRRREVQLLSLNDKKTRCMPTTSDKVGHTWFSDEKVFIVQTPTNAWNARVYAAVSAKCHVPLEWLLKSRKHFSQSVMVSAAMFKLGKTSPAFFDSSAKTNCDRVLGY